jgi:hypothetical protein
MELLHAGESPLPEEAGNEGGVPLGGAEEVGEALGASRSLMGSQEIGAQLAQEQALGAISELEEDLDRGEEGADEATVDLGIQLGEEGSEKGVELLAQVVGDLRSGVASLAIQGIIVVHGKETSRSVDACATYIYPLGGLFSRHPQTLG